MTHRYLLQLFTSCCLLAFSFGVLADDSSCCMGNVPPAADLSTPESALKSYWAIKAWEKDDIRIESAKIQERNWEAAAPYMISITTGPAKKYFEALRNPEPEVFERTITDVSYESPDRSVILVTIRNVTPIPKDAMPAQGDVEKRARGSDFRYVFVRDNAEWKLSEIWSVPTGRFPLRPTMIFQFLPSNYPSDVWYE